MRILIFVLIFFVAKIGHSESGGIKHKRIECRPDEVAKGFAMPKQTNIFIIIDNNDKKVKVYKAISEIKYSKTDYIIYKINPISIRFRKQDLKLNVPEYHLLRKDGRLFVENTIDGIFSHNYDCDIMPADFDPENFLISYVEKNIKKKEKENKF